MDKYTCTFVNFERKTGACPRKGIKEGEKKVTLKLLFG